MKQDKFWVLKNNNLITKTYLHSTSYINKQEGFKTIVEGYGTLKIKDEQNSAHFKYIRTTLTEGKELGVEVHYLK